MKKPPTISFGKDEIYFILHKYGCGVSFMKYKPLPLEDTGGWYFILYWRHRSFFTKRIIKTS